MPLRWGTHRPEKKKKNSKHSLDESQAIPSKKKTNPKHN